jgi:predicted ferric reductase
MWYPNHMQRFLIYGVGIVNLVLILLFWNKGSGAMLRSGDINNVFVALGRLAGLLAQFFILVQLTLIGRIRFIEQQFGFDKLNRVHRYIGYSWLFLVIWHPILITLGYSRIFGNTFVNHFVMTLQITQFLLALIGLFIMISVISISVAIIRKKLKYETWYFIHLTVYIAIGLMLYHQKDGSDFTHKQFYYYWFALNYLIFGLVLLYRFVRPLYLARKHAFRVEKIVEENGFVNSVYITGKNVEAFKYQAGQYAHITFLRKGMWYTHPFSFSVAPNGKYLRFSIKRSGDFTSQIQNIPPGTRVIIDGPFGIFTERVATKDKFLFIAGGIGITPIYALIESMAPRNKDMILLYGNKTRDEAAFINDLGSKTKVYNVLSQEKIEGTIQGFEFGFIDTEKIKRLAPDFLEREIYVCGPPVMMKMVVTSLKNLGVHNNNLHYERFAY